MSPLKNCFAVLSSFAVLVAASGCGSDGAPETAPPSVTAAPAASGIDPEVEQALAQLSPEDRELAEKQKMCPVGNQLLGSMGTPIKLNVDGVDVFICCAGCEDPLRADPEKYLGQNDADAPAEDTPAEDAPAAGESDADDQDA